MMINTISKPTKFSGEMYGTKVVVEYENSDVSLDEVMGAFETLATGLGYHPESLKNWIIERAEEYKEQDAQSENNEWDVTLEDGLDDEGDYFWEENKTNEVISILKEMEVDGDTMQYILEEVGMDEQMAIQLATKYFNEVEEHLYELGMERPKASKAKYTVNDNTPPYVSDDFQIGPEGAFEHTDEAYIESIVAAIKANQLKKKNGNG